MTPSSPVAQPAKDCFALLRQSGANDDTLVSAVSTQLWNPRKEKVSCQPHCPKITASEGQTCC